MANTPLTGRAYYDSARSQAKLVKRGYGQLEPNHLSAQHTAQIYAQLPAAADIEMLEQGQFVKYDYSAGVCDFTGKGEWMLVFNEVKIYQDFLGDADFAMIKDNYDARVYSPATKKVGDFVSHYVEGKDSAGEDIRRVARKNENPYEWYPQHDLFKTPIYENSHEKMPEGTVMVPRVMKTNVGDIFTTNTVDETFDDLTVGAVLAPNAKGILDLASAADSTMKFEVVKKYTMQDGQPGIKVMRIA